jgi:pyruvate dehydrogenase E2 component (dihydrolipoamide acetyltransferase)
MNELRMPSFGADMEDAEFVRWEVQPGQAVKRGVIACVVETQKGAIDVELWHDGTVARLMAEPGQRIPVGHVLALVAAEGEDWRAVAEQGAVAPAPAAVPASSSVSTTPAMPATSQSPASSSPRASPAARKRAAELGVDLSALAGDSPISLADVERAAAQRRPTPADGMRQAIAAAMSHSKREIPHYYLGAQIEVEAALRWLEAFNAQRPLAERVLFAALALRALALALLEAPSLNGRYIDGRFEPSTAVHIGVVTAMRGGGLIVPTVHGVHVRTLPALMQALRDALSRARSAQLRSSDLADSTITLTNLGDLGCDAVYGVIYPPQVAIVGLGRVAVRPVVRDGTVVAARTVHASLAGDHRVSDGMVGARFLGALAEHLAHPEAL